MFFRSDGTPDGAQNYLRFDHYRHFTPNGVQAELNQPLRSFTYVTKHTSP